MKTWISEEKTVVCGGVVEVYINIVLLDRLHYPDLVVDEEPEREVVGTSSGLEGRLQPDRLRPRSRTSHRAVAAGR